MRTGKNGEVSVPNTISVFHSNTSTLPCSSSPSELSAHIFLNLTIGYFLWNFLTKILHLFLATPSPSQTFSNLTIKSHHHKHHGLDPLIRSVSRVTAARANASSVFQLFSFLVVCSGMISNGLSFVAFFASFVTSYVCIHLSCLVCL